MPDDMSDLWHIRHKPWVAVADKPDGPICKACLKALAAWEREFGGEDGEGDFGDS